MEPLEKIIWNDKPLAYILRGHMNPTETNFVTPPEFNFQVGFIVYPSGGKIPRHIHRQIERQINQTSELLVVKEGRCEIDFYNDERDLVATKELSAGDIMLMISGGHGFRMLEDTVFLEVKQGPYVSLDEKERF